MLNIILNVVGGSVTFAYSVICFCLHFDSFCSKNLQLLAFSTNFPFGKDFRIFMTVVNFKEKYFQFKKYTISNFLIRYYIIIVL